MECRRNSAPAFARLPFVNMAGKLVCRPRLWQQDRFVRQVARAVKNGGYAIVSTFGPEGPTKCSGLGVVRYDAESLHRELGVKFRLLGSSKEFHQTPFGTTQQFLYYYYRLE
jgi:hypothetical protein